MAEGQGWDDVHTEPPARGERPSRAESGRERADAAARIRHLEDLLRRQVDRYQALALATGQLMWSTNADGLVVDPSPGWCAFTGQSPDEAHGAGWLAVVHPDDRERLEAAWRAALATKQAGEYRFRARRGDGQYRWLLVRSVPVFDERGDVREWVGSCADVTEREQAEQRTLDIVDAVLALAGAAVAPREVAPAPAPAGAGGTASVIGHIAVLTARAVGCGRVAVATVDPETEIMHPMTIAGFTPEEEAHWWAGWVPDCTVSRRLGEAVARSLRAGEVVQIDTGEPSARDRLAPYHVRTLFVIPMRVRDSLVGAIAIDDAGVEHSFAERDRALAGAVGKLAALVLERERLLREREEVGARALALEEANRRMDGFLSIAAHELKTPQTSIKVNVQVAQRRVRHLLDAMRGAGAETLGQLTLVHERVTRAIAALGRQERFVDDLLDVSRIQAGKLEMRPERMDLGEVVRQAVEEQRASHAERAISLEAPEHPVHVDAEPDRVGQVVANYLTNALKYSPSNRPVSVRLALDGRVARVSVRDEGPGIAAEQHARIWERFHRVPGIGHLSGSAVGLGLGLYICREIVERHGGAVGVESVPGAGSMFWFELPLPQGPA